jgi:hypothetical protein
MKITRITFLILALYVSIGLTNAQNQPANEKSVSQQVEEAQKFISMLDLSRAPLSKVKEAADRGELILALDLFRDYFVEKMSVRNSKENVRYYVWGATSPTDLLERGELIQGRYAKGTPLKVQIGIPGKINWCVETDLYEFISNLPRFFWTNKFIRGYFKTRDPNYVSAYVASFADYYRHHHSRIEQFIKSPTFDITNHEPLMWGKTITLFNLDRLQVFRQGFTAACQLRGTVSFDGEPMVAVEKATLDQVKAAINSSDLAVTLMGLVNETLNSFLNSVLAMPGAPNQQGGVGEDLISYSQMLDDFKDARKWSTFGEDKLLQYWNNGPILADGTEMEQALNYNLGTPLKLQMLDTMFPDDKPVWYQQVKEKGLYCLRRLATMVKPTGPLPVMDTYAIYDEKGNADTFVKGNLFYHDTLVDQILSSQWGIGKASTPKFTSVAYPYGGYYIMRSGWDKAAQYLFFKASRPGAGHCAEDALNLQLTAFGQDLLVGSGSIPYAKTDYRDYFASSFSYNTVSVDGLSQNAAYAKIENKPGYKQTLPGRWHTSDQFDFTEGDYLSGYGEIVPKSNPKTPQINDVKHHRQVLYLKVPGIWIIVDRLSSSSTHSYSQTWNFSSLFSAESVNVSSVDRLIETKQDKKPNVALYHFGTPHLEYMKFFGQMRPLVRGWAGSTQRHEVEAVDIHVNWTGSGDQLLVTLIEPRRNIGSAIKSSQAVGDAGFSATMKGGTTVLFQISDSPKNLKSNDVNAKASMLLSVITTERNQKGKMMKLQHGIALDCEEWNGKLATLKDFEYEISADSSTDFTPITVPSKFEWTVNNSSITPTY